MASSDARNALGSLFRCLQSTFQKYDRSARYKAWDSLLSGKGKSQVSKLLNSPSSPIVGIPGMLRFKEWFEQTEK